MSQFIANLFSKPFPHVKRYDKIRVDVLVTQLIDSVYASMIWEQWYYNVLSKLNNYYCWLAEEKDKEIFLAEVSKRKYDISDAAMQKAASESESSVREAYAALYGDGEDFDIDEFYD